MLNVETEELLEPLNVPELNKRLLEKSYNIYHFLLEEVKMQKNDNRLSFCFINHLQIVSEKISELYQQKVYQWLTNIGGGENGDHVGQHH